MTPQLSPAWGQLRALPAPDKRVLLAAAWHRETPLTALRAPRRTEPAGTPRQDTGTPRQGTAPARGRRQAADAAPGKARAPRSPLPAPEPAPPRPAPAVGADPAPRRAPGGRGAAAGAGGARRWRRGRAAARGGMRHGRAARSPAPHHRLHPAAPTERAAGHPAGPGEKAGMPRAPAASSARMPGRLAGREGGRDSGSVAVAPGLPEGLGSSGRSGFGRGSGCCHRGSVSFFPAMPGASPALARSRCWMLLDAVSHGAGLAGAEFGMLRDLGCWSSPGNRVGRCRVPCRESLRSGSAFVATGL